MSFSCSIWSLRSNMIKFHLYVRIAMTKYDKSLDSPFKNLQSINKLTYILLKALYSKKVKCSANSNGSK